MRQIDGDALVQWLKSPSGFSANCEDCTSIDCLDCIVEKAINNAPTIEAEPVRHGRWLWYSSTMMQCSACGRTVPRHRYKGCPHCRAKMSPLLGVKMGGGVRDAQR